MLGVVAVLALEIVMAKPPEPLEEVLPRATLIVDAVVLEVQKEDAVTPALASDEVPKQIVALQVTRVLRGTLDDAAKKKLVVTKPVSPYKLRVGVKGPWLLAVDAKTGERTILGRYGPDSYTFEKIEAKLREAPAR